MTLPVLPPNADTRSITERLAVLIRDFNSGRVEDLAQALTDIAALQADVTTLEGYTHVLQVVSTQTGAVATGTTVLPFDNTIPQNTEGDQYMSLAITPKSSASTLIIDVVWNGAANTAAYGLTVALFQDTTANALAASWVDGYTANASVNIKFTHVMTSGTTSATTFKVRAGRHAAGTTTFNGANGARLMGGVAASSIVIQEVLA